MFHVAIIMDGNGRWAHQRGLPRLAGHRRGVEALRRVLESAPDWGVTDLTVYAFSSDNWRRPAPEISGLMLLLREFLDRETRRCVENGVRFLAMGRRDRLPAAALAAVERAERATAGCGKLRFRVALDYSARDAILEAVRNGAATREAMTAMLAPDVDLLIRTAGEQRLSDYLLWECAYAEFWFTERLWPDFEPADLGEAIASFQTRQRRFGGVPAGYCEIPA